MSRTLSEATSSSATDRRGVVDARPVDRDELRRGLLAGGVAGPATHPLDNVRGNAQMLLDRDPTRSSGSPGCRTGSTSSASSTSSRPRPARRSTARRGPARCEILRADPRLRAAAAGGRLAPGAVNEASESCSRPATRSGLAHLYQSWRCSPRRARRRSAGARRSVAGRNGSTTTGRRAWDGVMVLTDGREPGTPTGPTRCSGSSPKERPTSCSRPRLRRGGDRGRVETIRSPT